jgi:hypothetical protein
MTGGFLTQCFRTWVELAGGERRWLAFVDGVILGSFHKTCGTRYQSGVPGASTTSQDFFTTTLHNGDTATPRKGKEHHPLIVMTRQLSISRCVSRHDMPRMKQQLRSSVQTARHSTERLKG